MIAMVPSSWFGGRDDDEDDADDDEACPACGGMGVAPSILPMPCPTCGGTGEVDE